MADIQRRNIGPLTRHQYGMRPALTTRCPGDKCDFAFQFAHLSRLCKRFSHR
jgi:hypothetical protein